MKLKLPDAWFPCGVVSVYLCVTVRVWRRFLHPGVTDKGNYNMFDVVRGVPAGAAFPAPRDAAPPESAWERGLRTAKEVRAHRHARTHAHTEQSSQRCVLVLIIIQLSAMPYLNDICIYICN